MLKFDISDFVAKTNKIAENLEAAAENLTHAGGFRIWEKSQGIVPVDTGLLKSTGYLATKSKGVRTTVEIGYGGPIAGYDEEYVWYAKTQERSKKYLSSSVTTEIFVSGIKAAFRQFIKNTNSAPGKTVNPPYPSQNNADSASLVVKKKNQDSGLVEEV